MATNYHVYQIDTDETGAAKLMDAHPKVGHSVLRIRNGKHDTEAPVTGLKLVSEKPLTIEGATYKQVSV